MINTIISEVDNGNEFAFTVLRNGVEVNFTVGKTVNIPIVEVSQIMRIIQTRRIIGKINLPDVSLESARNEILNLIR